MKYDIKYSININQKALQNSGLDLKDCAILDYLKGWFVSDDQSLETVKISEEGYEHKYIWIDFSTLIKQMPLLGIKQKASISDRLVKLESRGFIKRYPGPEGRLYVRLLPKVKITDFGEGVSQNKRSVSQDERIPLAKTNALPIKSILNKDIAADAAGPFSFKEYLDEMRRGQRHIQVIALYWEHTGVEHENKDQARAAVGRDLRSARALSGYGDDRILDTMDYLDTLEYLDKWTLETVHKYIDKKVGVNNLRIRN